MTKQIATSTTPYLRSAVLAVLVLGLAAATIKPLLAGKADAEQQPAITRLTVVTILVEDQEEALNWYTETLGFEKRTDQEWGGGQRWLTIAPRGQEFPEIALEKAPARYADQVGRAPGWVFETKDCQRDYDILAARGVEFVSPPQKMPWAIQAVFKDLYGNPITLVQGL